MKSDLLQPEPRRWLASSVLAPIEEGYVSYLRAGRYHPNTVRVYFASVAHFAKWATDEGLDLALIDEVAQRQFLDAHLPFCTCAAPVRKLRRELRVAIRHLLHVLRIEGQIPAAEQRDHISGELEGFDLHMLDVGGLADTTRRQRIHIVRRLLLEQFGDGEIDPEKLEPALVRRFVLGEGRGSSALPTTRIRDGEMRHRPWAPMFRGRKASARRRRLAARDHSHSQNQDAFYR